MSDSETSNTMNKSTKRKFVIDLSDCPDHTVPPPEKKFKTREEYQKLYRDCRKNYVRLQDDYFTLEDKYEEVLCKLKPREELEQQIERMKGLLEEQDRIIGEQTEVAVNIMEIAKDHKLRHERLVQRMENKNPICCVCMDHSPDNMVNPCSTCVSGHICLSCFCKWNKRHPGSTNCPTCNQPYPDDIQTTPERPRQRIVTLF